MAAIPTETAATSASQTKLGATTLTDVYTMSRHGAVEIHSIVFCNQGGATTYRLAIAYKGVADDASQYLAYDTAIAANAMVLIEFARGKRLSLGDVIRAYAGSADLSVNIEGAVAGVVT